MNAVEQSSALAIESLSSPQKVNVALLPVDTSMLEELSPCRVDASSLICVNSTLEGERRADQGSLPPPVLEEVPMPLPCRRIFSNVVQPPPGLEDMFTTTAPQASDTRHAQVEVRREYPADMCEAHGLKLCNRMLNCKTCTNSSCWEKSLLCHATKCCSNISRKRLPPGDRHAAKVLARQAKAELQALEPGEIAMRANARDRGLGYKWRAMETLQNCNPRSYTESCRTEVVTELWKLIKDDQTAHRIQESAKKALHIWENSKVIDQTQ